jgi:hypothetical protein
MLSLAKMCDTCTLTVPGAMNRRPGDGVVPQALADEADDLQFGGVRLRGEVRSDQQANVTAPAGGDPRKRLPIW